jgi:hypothetical protein
VTVCSATAIAKAIGVGQGDSIVVLEAVLNLFLAPWLREVVSAARTVKNSCCCK